MQNIIPRKFINAKIILGIILCLFACYHAATTTWYNTFTGFNYSGLFLIVLFIFLGVLNIKQIDQNTFLIKYKYLRTILIVTIVVLLLYSFITALNKKQPLTLDEMYKIERAHQKHVK